MNKNMFLGVVTAALLTSCSPYRYIAKKARPLLKDSSLSSAHVGIHIYDIDAAATIYDYQGDKYFIPASNIKLVSCYAALKSFGDSLVSIEVAENDTAVFVKSKGDPTMLHPDYPRQPAITFLKQVAKPVYLVARLKNPTPFGMGWSWSDYNYAYSAERSSFPVYGNVIKWIQERTGEPPTQENVMDESVVIYSLPEVNWKVRFSSDTSRKNFYVQRERFDNLFTIWQGFEKRSEQDVPFVTNGLQSALDLLADTVGQPVYLVENELPEKLVFRPILSQPVDSLLRPMMHRSDNFFAEQVLLMAGEQQFQELDESKIIARLLQEDLKDLPQVPRWADGSGLSRFNLFSPADFTYLLRKMKTKFGMERIKNILPTGGQGTLKEFYLQDSGYIFAKTGTLSGVVALSGYLFTSKGKWLAFSVLVNNHRGNAVAIRRQVEGFLQAVRKKY
jgi:D-alanyl-D-alanine carboxypeptidase/D-alanyl-D-alanine-endopeptidase (penicillin-binding protein 4)